MSESGNRLHLNGVHLLERVVEDSGRVDDLPPEVLVVHVADEERLGGEGVGLDVDIGASDLVHEGGLSDVGVSANEESTGGGVDGGETGHVLANLLEVGERILLATHDGSHAEESRKVSLRVRPKLNPSPRIHGNSDSPTEGSLLELLAAEERVSELDEAAVVLADRNDQVASSVELSESELVVVLVVEDVEKRRKERVKVLCDWNRWILATEPFAALAPRGSSEGVATHVHDGEVVQDLVKTLLESLLGELDLAHVEGPNTEGREKSARRRANRLALRLSSQASAAAK